MKTLQEQYNLIKEGKGHKGVFLKEAKTKFPNMINNLTTYNQATHILKKRSVISENYVDLKPINTIEPTKKENWETKFSNFLNESGEKSLNPIVNDNLKSNTKEQDEKIKADPKAKFEIENGSYGKYKKTSDGVENIASRNYDYSPKVDNINNVNAQEMNVGVYAEVKYNPELTLEEAQAVVIKNLSKDPQYYVKEGQFGVKGLGYQTEAAGLGTPKVNDGETYGGSGYSDKLKDSDNNWKVVKESIKNSLNENYVVGSGNPNSFAAMSGEVINTMLKEEGLDDFETQAPMEPQPVDEDSVDEESQYNDTIYSEGEKEEHEEARDKAIKSSTKKAKKENIDVKLDEIGKQGDIIKLEAQIGYLHDTIQEKVDRLTSISEDANLSELVDKKKMKIMQKEVKLLEKKRAKMEKVYEKMSGNAYKKIVDENE
tara:strand:- start:545 stop:1831 length:1287 start_codon:yes stop_codon:yes gene_type:complete